MTPQPAATPYDRQPTSDAERVRWRVGDGRGRRCVFADERHVGPPFALCATAEVAEAVVWEHNVMVAAREQAAMREAQ